MRSTPAPCRTPDDKYRMISESHPWAVRGRKWWGKTQQRLLQRLSGRWRGTGYFSLRASLHRLLITKGKQPFSKGRESLCPDIMWLWYGLRHPPSVLLITYTSNPTRSKHTVSLCCIKYAEVTWTCAPQINNRNQTWGLRCLAGKVLGLILALQERETSNVNIRS